LALALFPPPPVAAQAADAKADLGANAALKYWTAFAFLPSLDKREEKLLEEWNKVPLDPAALTLIERSRMSRDYLHRGALLPRCDWGLEYGEGWRLLLPHMERSRTLARLTALHARHEFEQGHWKSGSQDVTDLLKLARHLEMDQMIIPSLVGYSIERIAIEAAAPYLPELKGTFPEVPPPAGPTLSEMVLFERQIMAEWFLRELREAEKRKEGSWQAVWKEVFHQPEGPDREFRQAAKTFDQAVKMLEDSLPYYDQLAKVMALPPNKLDAQLPEFLKRIKTESPMAAYLLPAIAKLIPTQRRAQTQRALFQAALAIVEGGPDRLKDVKDPSGDGPFEYRALDGGFELKSKLLVKDKPLTLTVGRGKKE
jgi:hypothetical protein